jgi:hypothetical protein
MSPTEREDPDMTATFETVPDDVVERVIQIDENVRAARRIQYDAANIGNARGVGNMERLLEALYTERDAIAPRGGEIDRAARIVAYRRRNGTA